MSALQTGSHTLGAEIPYRRNTSDKRTGSLVFDHHLNQKLSDTPPAPGRLKRD